MTGTRCPLLVRTSPEPQTTEGRSRCPQSLYGSCTSRPAIATPSGRSVCLTRTESPWAASTSGRRLYTSGASSGPPPRSTMPCSRSRACTAGQSTRPGLTCPSTQTLIRPDSGRPRRPPRIGTPRAGVVPAGVGVRPRERHRRHIGIAELRADLEQHRRRVHLALGGTTVEREALGEREEAGGRLVAEAARTEVHADPDPALLVLHQVHV